MPENRKTGNARQAGRQNKKFSNSKIKTNCAETFQKPPKMQLCISITPASLSAAPRHFDALLQNGVGIDRLYSCKASSLRVAACKVTSRCLQMPEHVSTFSHRFRSTSPEGETRSSNPRHLTACEPPPNFATIRNCSGAQNLKNTNLLLGSFSCMRRAISTSTLPLPPTLCTPFTMPPQQKNTTFTTPFSSLVSQCDTLTSQNSPCGTNGSHMGKQDPPSMLGFGFHSEGPCRRRTWPSSLRWRAPRARSCP